MTNIMTPETIDWPLEARRIRQAFGLQGLCLFKPWYEGARQFQMDGNSLVPLGDNAKLFVAYEGVMKFTIWRSNGFDPSIGLDRASELDTYIGLTYDGKVRGQTFAGRYSNTLAKGLFHLDLLTPEVEAALKVSVSAHEKAEWTLEYERHYGF